LEERKKMSRGGRNGMKIRDENVQSRVFNFFLYFFVDGGLVVEVQKTIKMK
jgi:hypothetical protein